MTETTFVLVHGAWHGGWCWARVADILRSKGHVVYAPTLSGVGERSHLSTGRITLTTHVMDVVNEVIWKDLSDIVLCGHSYGGMVVTAAIEQLRERVSSIVYLDAFLPMNGQSLDEISGDVRATTEPHLVTPITAEVFNVNIADRDWVQSKMTPQPSVCFSERVSLTGALERIPRKAYLLAGSFSFPPFQGAFERLSQDPTWTTRVIPGGHDLMIDSPREVAEALLTAAHPPAPPPAQPPRARSDIGP